MKSHSKAMRPVGQIESCDVLKTKTSFIANTCGVCGLPFALSIEFEAICRRDGRGFYCPSGHSLHFPAANPPAKSAEDKQQLLFATHRVEQLEAKVEELTNASASRDIGDR